MTYARKNKFNAKKVKDDGYTFDSKAEHRRYCVLKLRQKAGEIACLEVHPRFKIKVNDVLICQYTADTRYLEFRPDPNNPERQVTHEVVEDVKSEPTRKKRDYRLTKKLMKAVHGIEIREAV
jgi:hypothetical protein